MERWERQRPQPERPPRPRGPTVAEIEQIRASDWTRFVDGRVAAASPHVTQVGWKRRAR